MSSNTIKVKVFRYDPDTDWVPSYKTYEVATNDNMNVLMLLRTIYEEHDRTLAFRSYNCAMHFCNSCMMTINGQVKHACRTGVKPGEEVLVEPMIGQPVIKDLVVDTGVSYSTPEHTFEIKRGTLIIKRKK